MLTLTINIASRVVKMVEAIETKLHREMRTTVYSQISPTELTAYVLVLTKIANIEK